MLASRFWHSSTPRCSLLRLSSYGVNSKARQLPKSFCQQKVCSTYDKFKCYSYATFTDFKCWNCQTILNIRPSLFCENCSLIQSSEQQHFNYFELFNIPHQYDIDTEQLTSNFRKLQSLVHPDKYSNKTQKEKVLSESFSSLLNKAYTTLLNPLLRGLYMLNNCGLSIEEGSTTMDTHFLDEIMEWNEQVENVNTKESLENVKTDIDNILQNLYREISKAFNVDNINQAKLLLSKAKYYSTLLKKIKEMDV